MPTLDAPSAREAARLLAAANDALTAYREYVDHYRSPITDLTVFDTICDLATDDLLVGDPQSVFATLLLDEADLYSRTASSFFERVSEMTGDLLSERGLSGDVDDTAPDLDDETRNALSFRAGECDALPEKSHFVLVEYSDGGETLHGPWAGPSSMDEATTWMNDVLPDDEDMADAYVVTTEGIRWRYRKYPLIVVNLPSEDGSAVEHVEYGMFA